MLSSFFSFYVEINISISRVFHFEYILMVEYAILLNSFLTDPKKAKVSLCRLKNAYTYISTGIESRKVCLF